MRDMDMYIYDIYIWDGIICIMRGAGHSLINCLWDSAGIQRCLWGGSLWFIPYAYEVSVWSSEGSWESGREGRGKKKVNDLLYIQLIPSGKGLRLCYDEIIVNYKKWNWEEWIWDK